MPLGIAGDDRVYIWNPPDRAERVEHRFLVAAATIGDGRGEHIAGRLNAGPARLDAVTDCSQRKLAVNVTIDSVTDTSTSATIRRPIFCLPCRAIAPAVRIPPSPPV